MSIFWSWQCLGPSLSRWLPAECCLGVPAAKGYIPNARKRRNTSIRRMVRASRWGRLPPWCSRQEEGGISTPGRVPEEQRGAHSSARRGYCWATTECQGISSVWHRRSPLSRHIQSCGSDGARPERGAAAVSKHSWEHAPPLLACFWLLKRKNTMRGKG